MFFNAKTVGGFRHFLETKVAEYNTLVEKQAKAMEEDAKYHKEHGVMTFAHQVHFLSWNAVMLAEQAVAANEASRLLMQLAGMEEGAQVPAQVRTAALEHVCQTMRISSRSTSASSNLVEDAQRAFWTEVAGMLLK